MRRLRFISALLLTSTCACGAHEIVRVSLDEVVAPFESFILLVRADQSLRVEALDRGDRLTMPLGYSEYSEVELTVLGYDQTLEALGVKPGLLEPGRGGRLPDTPTRELHVRVDGEDGPGTWTPMTSLSPDLALFESPAIYNTGCVDFEISRAHRLDTRNYLGAFIPIDDAAIAFTTRGGPDPGPARVFRVTFDRFEILEVPGFDDPDRHVAAGAAGSGGRLWITDRAALYVGTVEAGFEWVAGSTNTQSVRDWNAQIFVAPDAAGDRVYTLSHAREARVFDEPSGELRTLLPPLSPCPGRGDLDPRGGDIFVHDGVVHVLDPCSERGVVQIAADGRVVEGQIEDSPVGGISVAGAATSRGATLISTVIRESAVHVFEDERWRADTPFNTQRVFSFTPFRQGWVIGGKFGFATQYSDTGWCASMPGVGAGEVIGDLRASDTHVFASQGRYGLSGSESYSVVVLRAP